MSLSFVMKKIEGVATPSPKRSYTPYALETTFSESESIGKDAEVAFCIALVSDKSSVLMAIKRPPALCIEDLYFSSSTS